MHLFLLMSKSWRDLRWALTFIVSVIRIVQNTGGLLIYIMGHVQKFEETNKLRGRVDRSIVYFI